MNDEFVEVRDFRKHRWYWVENALLEKYGQDIGPYGIAVYNALCKFANNKTQQTRPSTYTIAKLTGMARSRVCEALDDLEEKGLVTAEHLGPPKPTRYTLMQLNEYKDEDEESSNGGW